MNLKTEKTFTLDEARAFSKRLIRKLTAVNKSDYQKSPITKKFK